MSSFEELKQRAAKKGLSINYAHVGGGYYGYYVFAADGAHKNTFTNLKDLEHYIANFSNIGIPQNVVSQRRAELSKPDYWTGKPKVDSLLGSNDTFAHRQIAEYQKRGMSEEKALEVYVNNVEGDTSQLPPKLTRYAKKKGWLKGY